MDLNEMVYEICDWRDHGGIWERKRNTATEHYRNFLNIFAIDIFETCMRFKSIYDNETFEFLTLYNNSNIIYLAEENNPIFLFSDD